jgi:hypothetical protein
MADDKKNYAFALIAIVAIVAIVGMVMIFMSFDSPQGTGSSNLYGAAMYAGGYDGGADCPASASCYCSGTETSTGRECQGKNVGDKCTTAAGESGTCQKN